MRKRFLDTYRLGILPLLYAFLISQTTWGQSVPAGPSFDCAKASTESERLICRDPRLATLDREMGEVYYAILQHLPPEQNKAFRYEHYEWSMHYRRTCNSPMTDEWRESCIEHYLKEHTKKLQIRLGELSSTSAGTEPTANDLLSKLKTLGVDSTVLKEIGGDIAPQESVVGYVEMSFGCKVVFTTRRIVSIATMPLVCRSTEWGEGGKIIIQGGNFQLRHDKLSGIVFGSARIRESHGSIPGQEEITDLIKKVGPSIVKSIWPYEVRFVGPNSEIVNRLYSVTDSQAEEISKLATTVHLRLFLSK